MVQLLFARLPQFKDDAASISSTKLVKDLSTSGITAGHPTHAQAETKTGNFTRRPFRQTFARLESTPTAIDSATNAIPATNIEPARTETEPEQPSDKHLSVIIPSFDDTTSIVQEVQQKAEPAATGTDEFINPRGIRFTTASPTNDPPSGRNQ